MSWTPLELRHKFSRILGVGLYNAILSTYTVCSICMRSTNTMAIHRELGVECVKCVLEPYGFDR